MSPLPIRDNRNNMMKMGVAEKFQLHNDLTEEKKKDC